METQHPEYHHQSSIKSDGSRPKIRIADVHGKFTNLKHLIFPILLTIFLGLPWVRFGGERLVLLWVERREFTLFGFAFNAQDIYLIFFLLTGIAFSLFFITALVGRVWCGWACPQTVFLEGVFRKIERWIEGSRSEQIKLEKGPWNTNRSVKFFIKHFAFIVVCLAMSITLTLYFIPGTYYLDLWREPFSHPLLMFWIFFLAGLFYFDFAWFREQVCLILCPYGRFQSALTDDDSLIIGYDKIRGEPRGKSKAQGAGDCIDCGKCIAVCPTGIDIRAGGLQLECIGCANCIDACDEIMTKMERPVGLIRYDSLNGLEGKKRRILRPRVYLYVVLLLIGATVAFLTFRERTSFEANVIRLAGPPFVLDQENIRNQFEIHLVNKENKAHAFTIEIQSAPNLKVILPIQEIELPARADRHIPWMVTFPAQDFKESFEMRVQIKDKTNDQNLERKVQFLGPQ
ncbi:MAG: cytochrome c oxidase accessory protein CcoG [Bdellovibrionota bacterium]